MNKKIIFFIFLFFSIAFIYAQNLQKSGYNDGKIFAYIEQKKGTVTDYYGNGRMDTLRIENISGQDITVQYCFKAVKLDENNRYEQEKMVYQNKTIKAGDNIRENGIAAHNSKIGSYYVESFAIMNVTINSNSISQSGNNKHAVTVPAWAQGRWGQSGGTRITATQLIQSVNNITLNCVRSSSGSVDFEGNLIIENNSVFMRIVIQSTDSPNRIKVDIFLDSGGRTQSSTDYSERYRGN